MEAVLYFPRTESGRRFRKAIAVSRSFRIVLSFFLCFPVFAWGQQIAEPASPVLVPRPAPKPANPAALEGRIKLDVVVTDGAGKPVSGLDSQDFTLLDNNKPIKTVSFHAFGGANANSGPPVEVILLLDTVNAEFRDVSFARREIQSFLQENGGHLAQPVSIFALTDTGLRAQRQPSTDGNELATELNQMDSVLRNNGVSTGGNGEIERYSSSIREISRITTFEERKPGRKLLLWIGPGWPLLDSVNFQTSFDSMKQSFDSIIELSTNLREAHIGVYSIAVGESNANTLTYRGYLKGVKTFRQASPSNLSVKVLATQTGGRILGPDNGLKAQIDNCVQDATAFYTLSFDPPHADHPDEYHDLKVQIGKPGLTAHTSTGYYNQP
jgi:VWFA-related protein